MKLRHYILVFTLAFSGSIFLASCLNEENRIPPNCYDGILNNGETGELNSNGLAFDCGGPCEPCDHCRNGRRDADLGETWIDCGGECGACSTCGNGILDPGELGIDCGGPCGDCENLCFNGVLDGLETEVDCGSLYCIACPTCDDEIINGGEIGIDCGNGECPNCESAANCVNGTWQQSSELYTDCGGPDCYDCDTLLTWTVGGDTFSCLDADIIYDATTSTLDVAGTAISGETFGFTIDLGAGTIVAGTSVDIDPDSGAGNTAGYNNGGLPFLYSFAGASLTVNIGFARFVWDPSGGSWVLTQDSILIGSFNGQLVDSAGESVNIEGSFKLPWLD